MSRNVLLHHEAMLQFKEGEVFWCCHFPKTVPWNAELNNFEHYSFMVILTHDGFIEKFEEPEITVREWLSNSYSCCFFDDYEMSLYWKYLRNMDFIHIWDEADPATKKHIHSVLNDDIVERKIKEFIEYFEREHPDKVVEIQFKNAELL